MPAVGPSAWSVADVTDWLASLELPASVVAQFKENAVAGPDLLELSDSDLVQELHCTSLQARKIRHGLEGLGYKAPAAAPSAPAAPPAAAPPAAAAAPAVPAAPATAEPDPRSCFAAADLQRYRQLADAIQGLETLQVASKVGQARQYSGKVKASLDAAQQALAGARRAQHEADADFKKLVDDKWYPGKVLGGKGKQEEKKAEAEAALKRATGAAQQAEQQVAGLQAQLGEAQKQQAAWEGKESELSRAKRELTELVSRMFAAPAWRASPSMCAVEDAARALDGQASEAARGVSTYGRGAQLLSSAVNHLRQALEGLGRTQAMGMVELVGIRRNNPMMDIAEMAIYQQANEACQVAAREAEEARGLLGSGLPRVDQSLLDSARRGLFVQMLAGGMLSDMYQLAQIRKSIEAVQQLLAQLQPAARWAQDNLSVYKVKDGELKGQAAAKRQELEGLRSAALGAALAASGAPAVPLEKLSLI